MRPVESSLLDHFSDLPDPRMVDKCDHLLIDIMMIAICATIANADGWVAIATFGESKQAWLKQWLALPNGIPSHDTFKRVFENLDAGAFQQRFMDWVQAVFSVTEGQVIAIDGKTLRGTCDKTGKSTLHVVSAWATANHLTLAQVKVAEKANEIVAIPSLLDLLTLKGCIVTIDAIACQKSIAEQLRDQQADYVLSVKGNQPTLLRHLTTVFDASDASSDRADYCETVDHQHGRVEQRQCWVLPDHTAQALGWRDCQTVVRITRTCQRSLTKTSQETHYYISSLPAQASLMLASIRAHWGIENSCHWVLDVVFREDASRTRTKNADDNLTLLRKIALNLLRQHPTKGSLKDKRYRCSLNEDYLLAVMQSSLNLMR